MSNLTNQQLQMLSSALVARELNLRSEANARLEEHREDVDIHQPSEILDMALAKTNLDLCNSMIKMSVHELKAIDAARSRMSEGNYGECTDCGCDIDFKRLKVYPIANRCIHCQSVHEKLQMNYSHKLFG